MCVNIFININIIIKSLPRPPSCSIKEAKYKTDWQVTGVFKPAEIHNLFSKFGRHRSPALSVYLKDRLHLTLVESFSFILRHRVDCCGSCVVSLCSQWREQAFRDGSSVCHRNPSGSLSQGACFFLLPTESMNMNHMNPTRCIYSTYTVVVVWLFATPGLFGSSLWLLVVPAVCPVGSRLQPGLIPRSTAAVRGAHLSQTLAQSCCVVAVLVVCF